MGIRQLVSSTLPGHVTRRQACHVTTLFGFCPCITLLTHATVYHLLGGSGWQLLCYCSLQTVSAASTVPQQDDSANHVPHM